MSVCLTDKLFLHSTCLISGNSSPGRSDACKFRSPYKILVFYLLIYIVYPFVCRRRSHSRCRSAKIQRRSRDRRSRSPHRRRSRSRDRRSRSHERCEGQGTGEDSSPGQGSTVKVQKEGSKYGFVCQKGKVNLLVP